jgi:hypothetical protein
MTEQTKKVNIGICLLATNAYFPLGIRFIKKFMHYNKEDSNNIIFYFFSDKEPNPYLSEKEQKNIIYTPQFHKSWTEGTNSKYKSLLSIKNKNLDYLFYFDADTNIKNNFSCDWFLGDLVTGEHFANRSWTNDEKPFDRNPNSKAFVPKNTSLSSTYYYGAFFGGKVKKVIEFARLMVEWQSEDKKISYEPRWNDESYLNCYFHFNPPQKVVYNEYFSFVISDKAGIHNTRDINLDWKDLEEEMLKNKNNIYEIHDMKCVSVLTKKINEDIY